MPSIKPTSSAQLISSKISINGLQPWRTLCSHGVVEYAMIAAQYPVETGIDYVNFDGSLQM